MVVFWVNSITHRVLATFLSSLTFAAIFSSNTNFLGETKLVRICLNSTGTFQLMLLLSARNGALKRQISVFLAKNELIKLRKLRP